MKSDPTAIYMYAQVEYYFVHKPMSNDVIVFVTSSNPLSYRLISSSCSTRVYSTTDNLGASCSGRGSVSCFTCSIHLEVSSEAEQDSNVRLHAPHHRRIGICMTINTFSVVNDDYRNSSIAETDMWYMYFPTTMP